MSNVTVSGTALPTPFMTILASDASQPGSPASYETCKLLYEYHPLAGKIIEKPVTLALSKRRKINIPSPIEEELRDAFEQEWDRLQCTERIRDTMHLSRVYGVAAVVYGSPELPTDQPIDPAKLYDLPNLYFNTYDPLNLAGSVVTNQNPNAPDFQKAQTTITAAGQPYHRSRTYTVFCGTPVYLSYQGSSFSFSGRSLFLRALYPLKSFIQTMTVDDLVSLKAGLIVAKIQQSGSIVNNLMQKAAGIKRQYLADASTGNVLSVQPEESIESIDLNNTDKAMTVARDNIIANIAAASDVPAIILKDEAFTQGFGEGTEDSKAVAQYIEALQREMDGLHAFFDNLVQRRAWSPAFYEGLKAEYPELLSGTTYDSFFYGAVKLFRTEWPTLIEEPKSEIVRRDSDKLKAMTDVVKTLGAMLDPLNKARVVQWFADNLNDLPDLFTGTFEFDMDALAEYEPPAPPAPPGFGGDGPKADDKPTTARADAEHWVTLHGGGEGKGSPVLINGQGEIVGGAGGKLDGKVLGHIKSKSKDVEKPTVKAPPGSEHVTDEPTDHEREWRDRLIKGWPAAHERIKKAGGGETEIQRERAALVDDLAALGMDRYEARQAIDKAFESAQPKGIDPEALKGSIKTMTEAAKRMAENPHVFGGNSMARRLELDVETLTELGMPEAEARDLLKTIHDEARAAAAKAAKPPQPATQDKPKVIPFARQKTTKAVSEAVISGGYARRADFGKMHVDVANDMAASLASHVERFPELAKSQGWAGSAQARADALHKAKVEKAIADNLPRMKAWYPDATDEHLSEQITKRIKKEKVKGYYAASYLGYGFGGDFDGVATNEKFGKSPAEFKKSLEFGTAQKFHPVGCDTFKSVADHEYGHELDKLLGLKDDPEFRAIHTDAYTANIAGRGKAWVKENLSEYANANAKEFIAEAWAEFNNNPEPREIARKIGELIERKYKAKFGGGQ